MRCFFTTRTRPAAIQLEQACFAGAARFQKPRRKPPALLCFPCIFLCRRQPIAPFPVTISWFRPAAIDYSRAPISPSQTPEAPIGRRPQSFAPQNNSCARILDLRTIGPPRTRARTWKKATFLSSASMPVDLVGGAKGRGRRFWPAVSPGTSLRARIRAGFRTRWQRSHETPPSKQPALIALPTATVKGGIKTAEKCGPLLVIESHRLQRHDYGGQTEYPDFNQTLLR